MKFKFLSSLNDLVFYILGAAIYSAAITVLISPNQISPGGFTGIASVLNSIWGVSTGMLLLIMNIPVLVIAFLRFGGGFIIKTATASIILSFFLEISENILPAFKVDKMLACVFGGIASGLGLSLFLLKGATSGGVDIIAKLVNTKYPYITVGRIILAFDSLVVLLAAIVYKNVESALYSVIELYTASKITDLMLYGSDKGKIVYIISDKTEEILKDINAAIRRGATILNAVGAYTGKNRRVLVCTVRRSEVSFVLKAVRVNDKQAFTVVSDAGEIFGNGFKKII